MPRREEDPETREAVAVAAVYARFADAANRHDWETMALQCDEGATWQANAGELSFRHEGRDAIRTWLLGNVPKVTVVHYLAGAPVVELAAPDRARGSVSIVELLRIEATGELKQLSGVYTDELVRRDGRWLFADRRFVLHHESKR